MKITFERALEVLEAMGYELEQAEPSQLADASLEPVAEGYMKCPACNDRGVIRQHFTELERMLIEDAFEKAVKKAAPLASQDTHATHVVRTKDPCHPWQDLTDGEIAQAVGSLLDEVYLADFRAVIAKFKEKNRV